MQGSVLGYMENRDGPFLKKKKKDKRKSNKEVSVYCKHLLIIIE